MAIEQLFNRPNCSISRDYGARHIIFFFFFVSLGQKKNDTLEWEAKIHFDAMQSCESDVNGWHGSPGKYLYTFFMLLLLPVQTGVQNNWQIFYRCRTFCYFAFSHVILHLFVCFIFFFILAERNGSVVWAWGLPLYRLIKQIKLHTLNFHTFINYNVDLVQ